jgi:hypothetical protein
MSETPRPHPEWLRHSAFLTITLPEPPQLQKYRGAQSVELDDSFDNCLADAALDELKASGVSMVRVRFYSGFGLEFEKSAGERVRQYIQAAHARELKVAAIVALGGVVPETLLLEEPESRNWLQVDGLGQSVAEDALHEPFRARPCYNSEAYLRYMERVCSAAVDTGADVIHFEGTAYNPEPQTCRCPTCVVAFRDFLRTRYGPLDEQTRERGTARFGHNNFTHVRPPSQSPSTAALDGPHQQEWQRFKAHVLAQCLDRLSTFVARRNIQCAISVDLPDPVNGAGSALGADLALQAAMVDLVRLQSCHGETDAISESSRQAAHGSARKKRRKISQEPDLFSSNSEGRVLEAPRALVLPQNVEAESDAETPSSRHIHEYIRELKSARALGISIEPRRQSVDLQTSLALNLAFHPSALLAVSEMFNEDAGEESRKVVRQFVEFYGRHRDELFRTAQPLQPCAVFYDTNSLAYNPHATRSSLHVIETYLQESQTGYAQVYSPQLDTISNYRCVILPNGLCLDDEFVQRIAKYVAAGGSIIAVEDAGQRDQWRRLRAQSAFAPLLGQDLQQPIYKEAGQGRACYLSKFDAATLAEALRFCGVQQAALEIQCDNGQIVAQLSRIVADGGEPAQLISVAVLAKGRTRIRCSIACEAAPAEVVLYSPFGDPVPVENQYENGRINITAAEVTGFIAIKVK